MLLCLFKKSVVVLSVPCIGGLMYKSFMPSVIIFLRSLICNVLSSSAISTEFIEIKMHGTMTKKNISSFASHKILSLYNEAYLLKIAVR